MNYSSLIQNRKSVREFTDKPVSDAKLQEIQLYYSACVRRLLPDLETKLLIFGNDAKQHLDHAAGYHSYIIGAQQYLVLLSAKRPHAGINAGYIMEDLVLKLRDMGLDSCWLTFTNSEQVKLALAIGTELDVAAIIAFGYGEKTTKRMRVNAESMSNVDITAERHYFMPKRSIYDMVFMNSWGNTAGLDEFIGFYDNMLWEAFYAASLSPSYLNRQPYGFIIHKDGITLVRRPDEYTDKIDGDLGLGIVLLHFDGVVSQWLGQIKWTLGQNTPVALPSGYAAIATAAL